MTQALETTRPLTTEEQKQVQTFAEFLIARRGPAPTPTPERINVDAVVGLCKGMGRDKTDKELIREAWDAITDKYMQD